MTSLCSPAVTSRSGSPFATKASCWWRGVSLRRSIWPTATRAPAMRRRWSMARLDRGRQTSPPHSPMPSGRNRPSWHSPGRMRRMRYINEYQSLDQFAMFQPVTKWNARVAHPSQAALLTTRATVGPERHQDLRISTCPRISSRRPQGCAIRRWMRRGTCAGAGWRRYRGNGRRTGSCAAPRCSLGMGFADPARQPHRPRHRHGLARGVHDGRRDDPERAPNFVGIVGRYSSATANAIATKADCVLALGTRFGRTRNQRVALAGPRSDGAANRSRSAGLRQCVHHRSACARISSCALARSSPSSLPPCLRRRAGRPSAATPCGSGVRCWPSARAKQRTQLRRYPR